MFKTDVKYSIAIKTSHFSSEQLLVFMKNILLAKYTVYLKNIDFLKNSRLNSHKNFTANVKYRIAMKPNHFSN